MFELSKHSICSGSTSIPRAVLSSSSTFMRKSSGSVCSRCFSALNLISLAFLALNSSKASLSPRTGTLNTILSISNSGMNGTITSRERAPNLALISDMNISRTASRLSSIFSLNPRLRDCTTAPMRIRMKLPKASPPSMTRENTSASPTMEFIIMDLL